MNTNETHAIGLMSGTSLDGLDLVYVCFTKDRTYEFDIIASDTVKYSDEWRKRLQNGISLNDQDLNQLDSDYGVFLGKQVNQFIQKNNIEKIDFIASHGHTIFHQPGQGITKQIGDGQLIANQTGLKVVCDFRTQDVQLGGQGAPLVPIGDRLLFSEFDACINLGGFANISFEQNDQRIAYDICPVNVVLNDFSQKLGYEYDSEGMLASKGRIDQQVLAQLNGLSFYQENPPKSLGIEWVHDCIFPIISQVDDVHDALRTYTEHIALQLVVNIQGYTNVLFTGGGVFNTFLANRIKSLSSSNIIMPNQTTIDYKEALIFALLGLLRIENKVNCLSSVTGAKRDHSSGVIFNG